MEEDVHKTQWGLKLITMNSAVKIDDSIKNTIHKI